MFHSEQNPPGYTTFAKPQRCLTSYALRMAIAVARACARALVRVRLFARATWESPCSPPPGPRRRTDSRDRQNGGGAGHGGGRRGHGGRGHERERSRSPPGDGSRTRAQRQLVCRARPSGLGFQSEAVGPNDAGSLVEADDPRTPSRCLRALRAPPPVRLQGSGSRTALPFLSLSSRLQTPDRGLEPPTRPSYPPPPCR